MKYLIEATDKYKKSNVYDEELSQKKGEKFFPEKGYQWQVDESRKNKLVEKGFAIVVKEIKKETKKEKEVEVARKEVSK